MLVNGPLVKQTNKKELRICSIHTI